MYIHSVCCDVVKGSNGHKLHYVSLRPVRGGMKSLIFHRTSSAQSSLETTIIYQTTPVIQLRRLSHITRLQSPNNLLHRLAHAFQVKLTGVRDLNSQMFFYGASDTNIGR